MATTRQPGIDHGLPGMGAVDDGTLVRTSSASAGPATASPLVPGQNEAELGSDAWLNGAGRGSFARSVLEARGNVADIARAKSFSGDNYWTEAPIGLHTAMTGHYYLAINRIGLFPQYTPKAALEVIGSAINHLFPMGGASGGHNSPLVVGDELRLTWGRFFSRVQVSYTCDYFFILATEWLHPLDGIAIHGVFRDRPSTAQPGSLWMFQEGFGRPMTMGKLGHTLGNTLLFGLTYPVLDQVRDTSFNYVMARDMWKTFALNARDLLGSSPRG